MGKSVNRKVDVAAMTALIERVLKDSTVTLETGSEAEAKRIRFQFYTWRKKEQDLAADPSHLSDIVIRLDQDGRITFSKGFENPTLRSLLAEQGIAVRNEEPGNPYEEN